MYLKRTIDKYLNEWKVDKYRKPLLIRGARQTGKSTSVRELAKNFKYFIEINGTKYEFNGIESVVVLKKQLLEISQQYLV